MTDSSRSNIERLKKNLPAGSLATQLVDAHRAATASDRTKDLAAALQKRLEQLRAALDQA